jgi:hypothetical protein
MLLLLPVLYLLLPCPVLRSFVFSCAMWLHRAGREHSGAAGSSAENNCRTDSSSARSGRDG